MTALHFHENKRMCDIIGTIFPRSQPVRWHCSQPRPLSCSRYKRHCFSHSSRSSQKDQSDRRLRHLSDSKQNKQSNITNKTTKKVMHCMSSFRAATCPWTLRPTIVWPCLESYVMYAYVWARWHTSHSCGL